MKLKIYTTKTCAYCPAVKQYFTSKNIPYEVVDCSSSPDAIYDASKHTGVLTVPQTILEMEDEEGTVITCVGVNRPKMAEIAEISIANKA